MADDEELSSFMAVNKAADDDHLLVTDYLPPGFRFHPTDEEIITHYLKEKVLNTSFSATAIGEADLNKSEPWDLPKKAKMGEKEWYFFCQRDRKYPTGMRTNRATESGYWKATGKDKEIYDMMRGGGGRGKSRNYSQHQLIIGMKKTLVFYTGRAPKGEKTNWVMHEYRLDGKFSYYNLPKTPQKEEWVVSRVFHKSTTTGGMKKIHILGGVIGDADDDDLLLLDGASSSLPPLVDVDVDVDLLAANNYSTTTTSRPPADAVSSFTDDCDQEDDFKKVMMMSNTNTASSSANNAAAAAYNNRFSDFSRNDYYFSTPNNNMINQNTYFQPSSSNNNNYNYYYPTTTALTTQNSIFGRSQIPPPFPFQSPPPPINPAAGYTSTDQTFNKVLEIRHCKVEQLSSSNVQTMALSFASQDTGLSTADMNNTAEISSSVVSKQHDNIAAGRRSNNTPSSFEDLVDDPQGPSSVLIGPNMAEFACLWDY